jgi:hypothetical protein
VKLYRVVSLVLAVVFAVTGLLFLFIPDKILTTFNNFSQVLGLSPSPVIGANFYLILAAGYMYLVTILAFLTFRHPDNRTFPSLLVHAKLASSVLSLAFFLGYGHYLIFLANFIIDGLIGILVIVLSRKVKEGAKWAYH